MTLSPSFLTHLVLVLLRALLPLAMRQVLPPHHQR